MMWEILQHLWLPKVEERISEHTASVLPLSCSKRSGQFQSNIKGISKFLKGWWKSVAVWLVRPQKGQQQKQADALINASLEEKVPCELISALVCWSCCLTRQQPQHLKTASAQQCLLPIQVLRNKVKSAIPRDMWRLKSTKQMNLISFLEQVLFWKAVLNFKFKELWA